MKKYLLISMLVCLSMMLNAQGLRLGILASPQVTWLNTSGTKDVSKTSTKMGFDIGLNVEKYFTENYAIATGITISTVGGGISYSDSVNMTVNDDNVLIAPETDLNFNLQYVRIPLGLKFRTNEIGYFTYYAQLGMSTGVNVKATLNTDDIEDENVSDEVNLFHAGYYIGGGLEYSLGGNAAILFGVTYYNGFMDVISTTNEKLTLSKVEFKVGVLF